MSTDRRWRRVTRGGLARLGAAPAVLWVLVLLAVCAGVAFRAFGFDRLGWWAVPVEAFTPWFLLPTLVLVASAAGVKRWRAVAVVAVLLAVQLAWLLPEVVPSGAGGSATGFRLSVFSANIEYDNNHVAGLGRQITAAAPDLVVLQELSALNLAALIKTGAVAAAPYSIVRPSGGFGTGVWSRWPIVHQHVTKVGGIPLVSFTLVTPAGDLDVIDVHTLPPENATAWRIWRSELHWIATQADAHPRRLAVIGDFNGTVDMASFRALRGHGLIDAHRASGGWAPTWPANRPWSPPLFRFDHVLVTKDIHPRRQRVGSAYGSDHLPLVTDLTLGS